MTYSNRISGISPNGLNEYGDLAHGPKASTVTSITDQ